MKKYRNGKPVNTTIPNRFIGKATLKARLLKAKMTSNKYVYPDDIRQMGKTTELIKLAFKYRNSLIIVNDCNARKIIIRMIERLSTPTSFKPTVVSISQPIYGAPSYIKSKIFIEEGIRLKSLCKFFLSYPVLLDNISLSYSPIPTKKQIREYKITNSVNNLCDTLGMDKRPLDCVDALTYSIGEMINVKQSN